MPSVTQVSIPSSRTPLTNSTTSASSFELGPRQAAPMQKRVAPACWALLAACRTRSRDISASRATPVLWCADWEQ